MRWPLRSSLATSTWWTCTGLADGDDDTTTPEEVDAIVADNGYAMATDVFSGATTPTGVPPDADTLAATACEDSQILVYDRPPNLGMRGYRHHAVPPEVRHRGRGLALQAG